MKEGVDLKPGPLYPLNQDQHSELRKFLERNIGKGYLRESQSPIASPILFVKKKDTKDMQLYINFRHLNNTTIKNWYLLPLILELQDQLQGSKWFTKFNIRDRYYQICMKEGEEWKTAIHTRLGLYKFTVIPMGLTNAPATF